MDGAAHARIGTRFAGRYDLKAILGEGGMGAVYRARHAFTGAEVALKIMHSGVARSKNARERFLREAQAPSAIGHPGIVQVTDAGVAEDGTLYLALELLSGEDLAAAVERGAVDAASVVAITIDLLDALGAAHESGLVHRDIKPENVFLSRDAEGNPEVHLLDFGITRQVSTAADDSKLTQTGTILGTPHYMSPEQARGQAVEARSDIYSVGGLLFYSLTGRPPFDAANYNLLIVAIMTNPAPGIRSVRSEIPEDLAAVVDRALSSDPSARYGSAAEMRAALSAVQPLNLAAVRPPQALAYDQTLPSQPGLPRTSPSTPIQHHAPPVLAAGVTTQPQDARTPQSGPPPAGGIPATMGASSLHPAPAAKKKSKAGLFLGLVVALGALVGGVIAAVILLPTGDPDPEVPPADVEAPPPVVDVTEVVPNPDAAMAPSSAVEARLAELEARAAEAEARAADVEREQAEEAERRAAAQKRAAMRRAEERAANESMQRAAVQRCQLDCFTEQARCRREGGGTGKAATDCQRAWMRCRQACER